VHAARPATRRVGRVRLRAAQRRRRGARLGRAPGLARRRRLDTPRLRGLPARAEGALRQTRLPLAHSYNARVKLEGVHPVTCITADAPGNVEFYAGTLGLRLVKKTVNQDDPTVYHLFYADERGDAGSDITFFEYPDSPPGRAGAGMVHRVAFRVASAESLDFWQQRVGGERTNGSLVFDDPERPSLQLAIAP